MIVVDYPCSDLCPDHTTRIIHYDVPADKKICARVGGAIRQEWVPYVISVKQKPFCLPKILAEAEAARLAQQMPHKPGPARQPPRLRARFDEYFTDADYPMSAVRLRQSGTVQVGLDIGADGRVSRCLVRRSSGFPELDRATCRNCAEPQPFPACPGCFRCPDRLSSGLRTHLAAPSLERRPLNGSPAHAYIVWRWRAS